MTSLVTGAAGFVGQWLVQSLLKRGEKVYGFALQEPFAMEILTPSERSEVSWIHGDMRDGESIAKAVADARPDAVYHLAAVTFIPHAGVDPVGTYDVNVMGAVRLLGAVAKYQSLAGHRPRVLIVGSAEQYGSHPLEDQPLREATRQFPATVYAASKAAQEILALQAFKMGQVDVILTRSFNHSGPGQNSHFLLPALVKRLKIAAASSSKKFTIGNTTPVRDFLHVTDVVDAYLALMRKGSPGSVYNVSSGEGLTVGQLASVVRRIGEVDAVLTHDPALARRVDVEYLVGDNSKLREVGWKPRRTVDDIVKDLWLGTEQAANNSALQIDS